MPRRKANPLVNLAKVMAQEIDDFVSVYDKAGDKEKVIEDLGDLTRLRKQNIDLYTRLTLALGLHQKVEEETDQHLILYHSNQNGKDESTNYERIHAMLMFLIQTYVDVSYHDTM